MKKLKKILLLMTCAFVLLGTTACSSRDNADNGADQTTQDKNTDTQDDKNKDNRDDKNTDTMNDATGGDKNGVLDNAVDDVTDGVDDVTDDITDDVDKAADDLTEDNGPQKDTDNSDRENSN